MTLLKRWSEGTGVCCALSCCLQRSSWAEAQQILATSAGEGGNDLLGNKRQTGHQKLKAGNLALVHNPTLLPFEVKAMCHECTWLQP